MAVVIYHANCMDGWCAAFKAWQVLSLRRLTASLQVADSSRARVS